MHKMIGIIQKLDKMKLCAITTLILLLTAAAVLTKKPHAWIMSLICSVWLVCWLIVIIIQSLDNSSGKKNKGDT